MLKNITKQSKHIFIDKRLIPKKKAFVIQKTIHPLICRSSELIKCNCHVGKIYPVPYFYRKKPKSEN